MIACRQLIKLEFGGESPLTVRYGLRQSNKIISRPVASFRSAYAFDKLEFVGVNDENFIYDWWHYGSWKNNCVPTAQTGFTE